MLKIKKIPDNLIFAPYRYAWLEDDGTKHEMFLICIMLGNMVVRMTNFHKYIGPSNNTKYLYASNEDSARRVCNFFTYVLFEHYGKYKIDRITDIPFQAAVDYLSNYAKTKKKSGGYIGRDSVEKERNVVCHFMCNLKKKRCDYNEHFYVKKVLGELSSTNKLTSKKRNRVVWEYEIPATYLGKEGNDLMRDIPQKAVPMILKAIKREAPELLFAVMLQLCAGLREGEAVNVRRASSIYPNGIRYVKENGKFTNFEVDLSKEYELRSDRKYVGKIKIKRKQSVHPIFLELVQEAYEEHLKMINDKYLESEAPMFVNYCISSKTGKRMAISAQTYCKRIIKIVREIVVPELLKSDDTELRIYGMMLNEKNWGLHAFRHWFTVQLVLNGEDMNGVAFWRGDSSLESAYTYLQNKGDIMRLYEKASEEVGADIMSAIKKEDSDGL